MPIPFVPALENVQYGSCEQVSPLIRRVIANNPSKFTYRGTGTYIVGNGDVVVIDPGPILGSHRTALENALQGERVVGIVATHCHGDHSPLAQWMKETYGAPTYAFGPHPHYEVVANDEDDEDDKDDVDASGSETDVREHVDTAFVPDVFVKDGEKFLTVGSWSLTGVLPRGTHQIICVLHSMLKRHSLRVITSWGGVQQWSPLPMETCVTTLPRYVSCRRVTTRCCGQHTETPLPIRSPFCAHIWNIVRNAKHKYLHRYTLG